MEKLATIHAELTDEGVTVKISRESSGCSGSYRSNYCAGNELLKE